MANKQNQGPQVPQRMSPESLQAGLDETTVDLNRSGVQYYETTENLENKILDLLVNVYGLEQADRVLIRPIMEKGARDRVSYVACAVTFTTNRGEDIKPAYGGPKGSSQQAKFLKAAGVYGSKRGQFDTSVRFKEVMAPIAAEWRDNDIVIQTYPYAPNGAVVIVDFLALLCLCLAIDDNDPYNVAVTGIKRIDGNRYTVEFVKYIDTTSGKKRGRHNSGINYRQLEEDLFGRR